MPHLQRYALDHLVLMLIEYVMPYVIWLKHIVPAISHVYNVVHIHQLILIPHLNVPFRTDGVVSLKFYGLSGFIEIQKESKN